MVKTCYSKAAERFGNLDPARYGFALGFDERQGGLPAPKERKTIAAPRRAQETVEPPGLRPASSGTERHMPPHQEQARRHASEKGGAR